jgi:tRNA-splicing ligase RtcB
MSITGKTLIEMGYKSGPWFPAALIAAQKVADAGGDAAAIRAAVDELAPPLTVPLRRAGALAHRMNIRAEMPGDADNIASVERHMAELMRVPTIRAGAVMPDACPAGAAPGTIPVGGVIAAENAIHPGMHSADICCSMAVTIFDDHDPKRLLDSGMKRSHFGGGGRARGAQFTPPQEVMQAFADNFFLKSLTSAAIEHFATQGDGNHFFYVGRVKSSGELALVTHHGSRKPGALLYKYGMSTAEWFRQKLSPETPRHNAWIPADTRQGEDYWQALQTIRAWTKANHFQIHDLIAEHLGLKRRDRFWNEHNFVFRKTDGLFYHAKGATPAFANYADDTNGLTLIPLNMREPILIARGRNADNGLGFAPHGAGRNFSRTAFMRSFGNASTGDIVGEQTKGIDARFFCGHPDLSELPGAYKNADSVRAQIAEYELADVVDTIEPVGCIMAGDWQHDAPWRNKKKKARMDRRPDVDDAEDDA